MALAGCGSGSSSSSKTSTAQLTTSASTAATTPSQTAATTATTTRSIPASNGSGTAILPASFSIDAAGKITPPVVSGPVDTTIELQVSSAAGHPVTVQVASRSLTVPPHSHTSMKLAGLKAGRYPIAVDGDRRAALVIGAQPGP